MSSLYRDVQALTTPRVPPGTGNIAALDGAVLVVNTRAGMVRLRKEPTDVTRYSVGDKVRIVGDTARGKVVDNTMTYSL